MSIQTNVDLKTLHTFGFDIQAKTFLSVNNLQQLQQAVVDYPKAFILGGGSNILPLRNLTMPVLHINIMNKKTVRTTDEHIWIRVGAGENWHQFVLWCIENDFGGVENLSLIPGKVGAAPMQNIGAYGVEVKSLIEYVEVVDRSTGDTHIIPNSDCTFGYRTSIFKTTARNRFVISHVCFKLTQRQHVMNTSYGAIQTQLEAMGVQSPTIKDVSDAVIHIRQQKLPDPKEIGNAGSFFKNPVVDADTFQRLLNAHPTIPNYPQADGDVKVPAGWLIEQCGLKGAQVGETGTHKNQALVIVNYGKANGQQVFDFSQQIIDTVRAQFGIELEREVNIVPER